jgi:single-strand DNA-binding protein
MSTLITITGNLAADPELRYTNANKAVVNFTVMTSRKVESNGTWTDMDTTGWRVTAWETMAENIAEGFRKGDPVIVQGWAAEKTWEKDGQTNRRIEVTARNVGFDVRNRSLPAMHDGPDDKAPVNTKPSVPPLSDDDIPF